MKGTTLWRKWLKAVSALMLGVTVNVNAADTVTWKEEVLLHDGSKLIAERTVKRGGRHEIGQQPPIKEQSLTFTLPGTNEHVIWKSQFSKDTGLADFQPLLLDTYSGSAYVVTHPVGCLSYNKWGRPNPPYVIFKYESKEWKRITLQELPEGIKTPNIIFGSPDNHAKKLGVGLVNAEIIQKINSSLRQPEYKTILREPLPKERVNAMCEERVLYKGHWILPDDPIARKFIDQQKR